MKNGFVLIPLFALSMCITPGLTDHSIGPVMANYRPLRGIASGPLQMTIVAVFSGYTRPVYVTEVPRSNATFTYGVGCYYWMLCLGRKDVGTINPGNPLVAIHSVDERIGAADFGYFAHTREVRINGWTRDAWMKKYGTLDNIPDSARVAQNVELNDGTHFNKAFLYWQDSKLVILSSDGEMRLAAGDQIKKIF